MSQMNINDLHISITRDTIIVNGEETILPLKVREEDNEISVINGQIKVNGYEFDPETKVFNQTSSNFFWKLLELIFDQYETNMEM